MTATLQSVGFAVSGAVLMQVLPGLLMQSQVTGATWGWSTTPQCKPAAGSNWAFSADVEAGTSGTIVCATSGASPPDAGSTVACPSSDGQMSPDKGWWNNCGSGQGPCTPQMEIGSGRICTDAAAATTTVAATTTTAAAAAGATTVAAAATTAAAGMANASTTTATSAAGATTMSPAAMAAMTTTKAAGYGAVSFADNGAAPGLLIAVAALAHLV
mmetsp:Transcript_91279/g.164822  ORF Transcript_91279/g.164822 Transcript_91279/m.164822 type:complete len:215 (+) Transcript_91279:80-724(+)